MRELLEVSLQRAFEKFNEELMKKRKEQEKKSLLRPSALTAIIQLMHARSRWPTVMAELTQKFAYKRAECAQKIMERDEEENWMITYKDQTVNDPKVIEQQEKDWVTDNDDDGDDFSPPAPIQRPPLQIRRRRGRRGKLLCVRFAPY